MVKKQKNWEKIFEKKYSYFFTFLSFTFIRKLILQNTYNFIIIYNFICHVVYKLPQQPVKRIDESVSLSKHGIEKRKKKLRKFEKKYSFLFTFLSSTFIRKLISQNTYNFIIIYNFIRHMVYKSPQQPVKRIDESVSLSETRYRKA